MNGVPLVVADLTARVCAGPGVYVGVGGVRVHVSAIELGSVVSGELAPTVTVTFAVTVTSTPFETVLKRNVGALAPEVRPAHPLAARTVKVMPAVELLELRVLTEGVVTTRPVPIETAVTTSVLEPVRAVIGLTITFAAVPGPVAVLQVRVTEPGVAVKRFTA